MASRHRVDAPVIAMVCAVVALKAWRTYRALPQAVPNPPMADRGRVSIVVPARNEAERLPALLASLRTLRYPNREVVVVDDESADGTAEVAAAYGVRLARAGALPDGWSGKCHACSVGAEASSGDWLLFADADTIHEPESIDAALRLARDGVGLVSLLARQKCGSLFERVVLPYAYALYFAGARRPNAAGGTVIANGQFMLFPRASYDRVGGHAAIRGSLVEDVAMAKLIAAGGERVVLARGEAVLRVRMYDGLPSLLEGFTKNAVRFLAESPRGALVTAPAQAATVAAVVGALRSRSPRAIVGTWALLSAGFLPWYRLFGTPVSALLGPAAAAVFQAIAIESIRRTVLRSATVWRGRRY